MPATAQILKPSTYSLPAPQLIAWGLFLLLAYIGFVYMLAFGLDITDEGFYLQSVMYPDNDLFTNSQFGFVLHPLWLIVGENIYLFRVSFWSLQIALSFVLFQSLIKQRFALDRLWTNLLSASFAALIVGYLHDWLPTPSYNSLALVAAQLFCIAFITTTNWNIARGLLITFAGTLAFLSKPTVAILLIIFSVIAMIFSANERSKAFKILALSATISSLLLLIFAFVSHGSPIKFVNNLLTALNVADMLYGKDAAWSSWHNILWKDDDLDVSIDPRILSIMFCCAAVFFLAPLAFSNKLLGAIGFRWVKSALLVMTCSFILLVSLVIAGVFDGGFLNASVINNDSPNFRPFDRVILKWLMPLSMFCGLLASAALSKKIDIQTFGKTSLLILTPYAFVVGTSLSYYIGISMLSVFCYAACICLVNDQKQLLSVSCLLVYGFCMLALSMPFSGRELYRQPALWGNAHIGNADRIAQGPLNHMVLSKPVDQYINQLSELAYANGFKRGGGIIDLTGASPGALFAINAKSVGTPWLIGKHPGSADFARFKFRQVERSELNAAWVLIEKWHRTVSPEVLDTMNRTLEEDYIEVGSVTLPKDFGGRFSMNTQTLYKPINP